MYHVVTQLTVGGGYAIKSPHCDCPLRNEMLAFCKG